MNEGHENTIISGYTTTPTQSIKISLKQYGTQLAQIFLCVTSSWAVKHTSYDVHPIAFGVFTFLLGHGLFGIIKVTVSDKSKKLIGGFYDYSEFLSRILPLPLINGQMSFDYHYSAMTSYFRVSSCLFPIGFNVLFKKWNFEAQADSKTAIVKVISYSNSGSIGFIGLMYKNYWAFDLSVLSLANVLAFGYLEDKHSAPKGEYHLVALAFFNIFAVNALSNECQF